jgi:hypothetical protein
MQKQFNAGSDPDVLVAANEDFPPTPATAAHTPEIPEAEIRGWSAYEIWHSRIRPQPGIRSLFLPQR